jgi:hypothetical protein
MQQDRGSAKHFFGCSTSKGQEQDRLWVDTQLDESRNSIGKRSGLARTGTSDDEGRTIRMLDRFKLRGVQLRLIRDLELRLGHAALAHAAKHEALWRGFCRRFGSCDVRGSRYG